MITFLLFFFTSIRRDFLNKKITVLFLFFVFLFIIPFFYQLTFSKYIFDFSFISAKIVIDKKPEIEVISVSNTNIGYETYANKTHEITFIVKVKEKNITINQFNREHINILVNHEQLDCDINIELLSSNTQELTYQISLSNIPSNGILSLVFPQGIIQDHLGQKNDYQKFDTTISIDNIAPNATSEEISIENNQSEYKIHSNEALRSVSGWTFSNANMCLSKIFSSPVTYLLPITDYAGNTSEILVSVVNAKNMILYYINYNGYRFSKFNQSGEIAGRQAIIDNSNQKSEIIFTYLDGTIPKDTLQSRIFDYTYWGENTTAVCKYSEINYSYGYNPSPTSWYDSNGKNTVYTLGKLCVQLGGQGHNLANNSCKTLNKPIPEDIAKQNLYGLSGVAFQLKNCEEYSIVYQIYVPNIGWLKSASDGEESTYAHNKPFSAIRMNIVPKSEKQYLMNYWNRVMYTNAID